MTAPTPLPSYGDAFRQGLKPDPLMTVSAWADQHRMLSSVASGEPGLWRTSRTPYLKEIMDCLSPSSPVERVVFMKGAQIGGTEAGLCWIGYIIHLAPGPVLLVQPTLETAKRHSKQRIDPMIETSNVLKDLVKDPRSRDSGNTVLGKEFPGGVLVMTGANSAVGLRSMPVRYLFMDEIDGYPSDADGEGDPVALAIQRTVTFANRKVLIVSTPTIKGFSRIESAFAESDRRRYWVPLFIVGVDAAKEAIYARLRLKEPGPGYCHFPHDRDGEWFRQLTAERITTRFHRGRPIREWEKAGW